MSDDNVFPITRKEGTFYVIIRAAETVKQYETDRGLVEYVKPLVEITTTNPADRDNTGYITLRGRKYSFDYYLHPLTVEPYEAFDGAKTGRPVRWGVDYTSRAYANEAGNGVDWKSGARDTLDRLRDEVLDHFAEQHPKWVRVSEGLRLQSDWARAEGEAKELARKLRTAEAEAAALRSRLDSFRV